jgi:hypothetical protein
MRSYPARPGYRVLQAIFIINIYLIKLINKTENYEFIVTRAFKINGKLGIGQYNIKSILNYSQPQYIKGTYSAVVMRQCRQCRH